MAYQKGSGFVGLRAYLGANQQAGAALGQQVLGQVQGAQQAAQALGTNTINNFQQQVDAGTPQYLEPNSIGDAQRKAAAATYTGPEALTPDQIAAMTAGADKAAEVAGLGRTDAGVSTLLQQQHGAGYTGVGGRSLDAALTRRGAGASLDAATKGVAGLRSYLGGLPGQAAAVADRGKDIASGVGMRYSQWEPPPTYGEDVRRNPISTPGSMPDKPPKNRGAINNGLQWFFGGGR